MDQGLRLDYAAPEPRRPLSRLAVVGLVASVPSPLIAVVVGQSLAELLPDSIRTPIAVTAVSGCMVAPMALCIWALIRARRRNLRGRWWATAGVIVAGFWLLVFIASVTLE